MGVWHATCGRRLGEPAREVVPLALMFVLEGVYDAVVHEVEISGSRECRRDVLAEESEGELQRVLPNLEVYRPAGGGPPDAAVRKELASFLRFHHGLEVLEEARGYLEDWTEDAAD